MKRRETDVAAPVAKWLKEYAWDVYQEVSLGYADRRVDIVATRGPIIWAIEVKQSMSLALLDQAMSLVQIAHQVSVATPRLRHKGGLRYIDEVLRVKGLGRLSVNGEYIFESVTPELHRWARVGRIRDNLCEEQKDGWAQAGSNRGGFFTPFAGTRRALLTFVESHPGCTLKEAIAGIEHHYSTDKSALGSLYGLIGKIITEVRIERDGRRLRLYAVNDSVPERLA